MVTMTIRRRWFMTNCNCNYCSADCRGLQETADCTVKVTGELREENTGMTAHWSDKLVFKNGLQELQD